MEHLLSSATKGNPATMKDAGVVVHEDSPEALHNQFDAVNKELDKFRDLCARNKNSKFLKVSQLVQLKFCGKLGHTAVHCRLE